MPIGFAMRSIYCLIALVTRMDETRTWANLD